MQDPELYQAVLSRHSVRRYESSALSEDTIRRIHKLAAEIRLLIPGNRFEIQFRNSIPGEDLASVVGGYGRIVSAPHFLVLFVTGHEFLLEESGYCTERLAVQLNRDGLGTCFIGCISQESAVKARFNLPESARTGALLAIGWPSQGAGGRFFNRMTRKIAGAENKLPLSELFFMESFDVPGVPPPELLPALDAARRAPSAVNAQPWRFLWHGQRLHVFIKRTNAKYGGKDKANYRFIDGGIVLANLSLALEAYGHSYRWAMLTDAAADLPDHPPDLQPLAALDVDFR